jgi:hypothetical protein
VTVRALVALAVVVVAALGARAQAPSDAVHFRQLRVPSPTGEARVLVTYARRTDGHDHPPHERLPIVVALHGQGEARRGPDRGFLGWVNDYHLPDAFAALGRGALRSDDFLGFVREEHLRALNAALHAAPFRGVMVVTPYTPDLMAETPGSPALGAYGDWVAGPLLDAVRSEFEFAARTREGTGIDGVSLGGMLSLEVGLHHREAFAAVGAIQPAIRDRVAAMTALADGSQRIRLLSSDDDPFLGVTQALSEALRARHVEHEIVVTPGPHGYDFNRGPGSIELLYFGDRTLAHEAM